MKKRNNSLLKISIPRLVIFHKQRYYSIFMENNSQMNKARKSSFCLNCNTPLQKDDNFCPKCGQENKDQKVSLQVLLNDFFSNYLNFDSAFFKTIPVFLTKPGKLTTTFNEGKRKHFLHPIRLYLILSLFYFFTISMIIPPDILDRVMTSKINNEETRNLIQVELKESISDNDSAELKQIIGNEGTNKIDSNFKLQDSTKVNSNPKRNPWLELKLAAQDPQISDSTFLEIFKKSPYGLESTLDLKLERNFIANSNIYVLNSARNLPIMMFLLLPIFALLLKILYLGTNTYYVEHLISGLHMHSFAYFIYGLGLLLLNYQLENLLLITSICFIIVSTYSYISLLKMYQQGWLVTLIKFWTLGFFYFSILFLAIGAELYLSLIML